MGKVVIDGAQDVEIDSAEAFYKFNNIAASCRSTSSTFKNDTSSRSHSICHLTFTNSNFPSMPGELFIIDLAGSESSADMQFHDKDLIK